MDVNPSGKNGNENIKCIVSNFPYSDLRNFSPSNIIEIRKCLTFLLTISKTDLFYTNVKALKYTLEFATTTLYSLDNIFTQEVFVELLTLLKQILLRLPASTKLKDVFPKIDALFDYLLYISDLDISCTYCSDVCESILLQLLKTVKISPHIDKALAERLNNLKEIEANREINGISEVVLYKFPFESKSYKLCAFWLMEDSVQILKEVEVENIQDHIRITNIIRNIYTFFMKVFGPVSTDLQMRKYQDSIMHFVQDLTSLSPTLIKLCCTKNIGPNARELLGFILHHFLREQGILSQDIVSITKEELDRFPENLKDWPTSFTRTFFWICHLLYYHKRSVWNIEEICGAISRLIRIKTHRKAINVQVLKSVCYIYPIMLQGYTRRIKRRTIGEDILNCILPKFIPLIHKILSLAKSQCLWLMCKGTKKIQIATLKFWLDNSSQENLDMVKEILISTKTEIFLIDILLTSGDSKDCIVHRTIEMIQSLHNRAIIKQIPMLISMFSSNLKIVGTLIQACCHDVPQDKSIVYKIFNIICQILKINPNDEVLTNVCHYAGNLLTALKSDKDFIHSICTNQFWIRYPISRLNGNNEIMIAAILELFTKMFKYQKKPCYTNEPVILDLTPLLVKSKNVVEKTINLLSQLLKLKTYTFITLKEGSILFILYKLYDLTDDSYLSAKVFDCLIGLMKMKWYYLINSPMLGMLVEERCNFSSRRTQAATCSKFIFFWIKLMSMNPNKNFCYLPPEGILTIFIKRLVGPNNSTVNKYLHFISVIYNREDYDYVDDELTYRFTTGLCI